MRLGIRVDVDSGSQAKKGYQPRDHGCQMRESHQQRREQRSGSLRHQEINLPSKGSSVQLEYNLFDDP